MAHPLAEPRFVPYRPPRLRPGEGLSSLDHDGARARARRSVRSFAPDPVPRALIERALEIAGTAPSGAHRQPWHFVAIADPGPKRRDADVRKSSVPAERYRHYIDIDAYPEYATGTLPHDRSTLEARYGAAQVEQWGVAPWAIGEVVDSMETAMRAGDWTRVRFWIADLCHYVGDLHQPLHCTLNYDGQFTGNNGIHYRYETRMLDLNPQALQLDAGTVTYLSDPVDAAFAIAGVSEQNTGVILDADTQARAAAGGSTTSGAYYAGLWSRTSGLTLLRLGGASVGTASFVYTAWVNAGFPTVPGGTVAAEGSGVGLSLALAAGPTPARDGLTLRYTLPHAALPAFELVDARGRRVARIDAGAQPAGAGRFTWPLPRDVAAGVYFVRLVLAEGAAEARVVVAR